MASRNRSLRYIISEMINTPLIPTLFLTEAIKVYVSNGYVLTGTVVDFLFLGVASTLIWVFSDALAIDWGAVIGKRGKQ